MNSKIKKKILVIVILLLTGSFTTFAQTIIKELAVLVEHTDTPFQE